MEDDTYKLKKKKGALFTNDIINVKSQVVLIHKQKVKEGNLNQSSIELKTLLIKNDIIKQ